MASFGADVNAVANAIREMDAQFVRAASSKDSATLVENFYAEDAVLLPPDHPAVNGKAAIREFWEAVLASGFRSLALDTTRVEVSGNLAFGIGRFSMTVDAGAGPAEKTGKYVVVYRRIDSTRWLAVADMFSGDGK